MKAIYRARKAKKEIELQLQYYYELMAREALKHVGQEFNTCYAWELKGKIVAATQSIDILSENNIWDDSEK